MRSGFSFNNTMYSGVLSVLAHVNASMLEYVDVEVATDICCRQKRLLPKRLSQRRSSRPDDYPTLLRHDSDHAGHIESKATVK